jgi:hypothetical protein
MIDETQPNQRDPVAEAKSRRSVIAGVLIGAMPWLLFMIPKKMENSILILIFACFVAPVISGIVAAVPSTRKFGLGLLLASGLGWLVLGAICGGVVK